MAPDPIIPFQLAVIDLWAPVLNLHLYSRNVSGLAGTRIYKHLPTPPYVQIYHAYITGLTTILGNSPVLTFVVRTCPVVWFRQRIRAKVAVGTSRNPEVRIVQGGYFSPTM